MATATSNAPPAGAPTHPREGSHRRGGDRGRGRGRGRGGHGGRGDSRGGSRGGGHRRGRGDGHRATDGPGEEHGEATQQTTLQVGPSAPMATITPDADDAASDTSADICFICADPVRYSAIAPCNHVTCHICALRMRALYKWKACAHCRTESEFVIFTKDANKKWEEFTDSDIVARSDALGIKYDDSAICDDTTLLLRYNCPDPNCDRACRGWPDLHRHVRQEHGMVMCDLCTRHKKVFTHEHTLFTKTQLHKHERKGDDNPGSENQSGFKGHPECRFCNQRFYSNDELYEHCRHNHERCFICDRRSTGQQPTYYINYEELERHFQKSHYMCQDKECLEKKFVVFEHEVDLKAHVLQEHPGGLSKSERRDARRVDMSTFQDARPAYQPHGGRRGGRGTQEYMYRNEDRSQARTVQSAQSSTTRTFGGQLSADNFPPPDAAPPTPQTAQTPSIRPPTQPPAAARPPDAFPPLSGSASRPAAQPAAATRKPTPAEAFPPLGGPSRPSASASNGRATTRTTSNPTPSEPARPTARPSMTDEVRRLKHAAVIERASNLLRNDAKKLEIFRNTVSKFRAGAIDGENTVDIFWGLFDVSTADMGKLMNELIEIYEDEVKQSELRRAWNNWKAINEDYPPIAGASTSASTTTASTNRVLKLKSSTKRSGRSSTARQTAWGTAGHTYPIAEPSTGRSSKPSSGSATPTNGIGGARNTAAPAPWGGSAPQAAVGPSSIVYGPLANSRPKPAIKKDEFPSLPQQKKPAGWAPVPTKRSNWEPQAPEVNPWNPGSSSRDAGEEQGQQEQSGRKKKGKEKQILFRVGL